MAEFIDSGALRVATYGVVALLAAWWGVRERRGTAAHGVDWWPFYWFLSASLLVVMGIGRIVGDLASEFGREQARSGGWYEARRTVQAAVVIVVAVVWLVGVAVAVLRVPPRRRRYLPHIVALSTLVAFAAIRLVSLHQVDTVLYRREVAGVRIVAIVEMCLLAATTLVMIATARFPSEPQSASSPAPDDRQPSELEQA